MSRDFASEATDSQLFDLPVEFPASDYERHILIKKINADRCAFCAMSNSLWKARRKIAVGDYPNLKTAAYVLSSTQPCLQFRTTFERQPVAEGTRSRPFSRSYMKNKTGQRFLKIHLTAINELLQCPFVIHSPIRFPFQRSRRTTLDHRRQHRVLSVAVLSFSLAAALPTVSLRSSTKSETLIVRR